MATAQVIANKGQDWVKELLLSDPKSAVGMIESLFANAKRTKITPDKIYTLIRLAYDTELGLAQIASQAGVSGASVGQYFGLSLSKFRETYLAPIKLEGLTPKEKNDPSLPLWISDVRDFPLCDGDYTKAEPKHKGNSSRVLTAFGRAAFALCEDVDTSDPESVAAAALNLRSLARKKLLNLTDEWPLDNFVILFHDAAHGISFEEIDSKLKKAKNVSANKIDRAKIYEPISQRAKAVSRTLPKKNGTSNGNRPTQGGKLRSFVPGDEEDLKAGEALMQAALDKSGLG